MNLQAPVSNILNSNFRTIQQFKLQDHFTPTKTILVPLSSSLLCLPFSFLLHILTAALLLHLVLMAKKPNVHPVPVRSSARVSWFSSSNSNGRSSRTSVASDGCMDQVWSEEEKPKPTVYEVSESEDDKDENEKPDNFVIVPIHCNDQKESAKVEKFVMVGYPIQRKRLNVQGVQYIANVKWGRFASPRVSAVANCNGRFAFKFNSQEEIDKVMFKGPWVFDGVIFALQQVWSNQELEQATVTTISFWVQLHNLPPHSFNQSMVQKIGALIGSVRDIWFTDEDGAPYEDVVRLRVVMDLRRCFPPVIKLKRERRWVFIKYEKLPSICKYCGLITHGEDECRMIYNLSKIPHYLQDWAKLPVPGMQESPIHFPFGEWMCEQPLGH